MTGPINHEVRLTISLKRYDVFCMAVGLSGFDHNSIRFDDDCERAVITGWMSSINLLLSKYDELCRELDQIRRVLDVPYLGPSDVQP